MKNTPCHIERPPVTETPDKRQRGSKNIFKLAAGVAAFVAAALAAEKSADAQAVPFDDAVNAITEVGTNDPSGAQITRGLFPHRFRLTFSGLEPETYANTIFAGEYEIEDSPNGPEDGIIMRRLGPVLKVPNTGEAATYFEIDRGDGRRTPIWANYFEIHDGSASKWITDTACPATVAALHPSNVPNELKIVAGPFNVLACAGTERGSHDVWRRPRTDVNFFGAIWESIYAVGDPYNGLLDAVESTAEDEIAAPEAGSLLAVTRAAEDGNQFVKILARDEETGELKHLQRNPDGTWTLESPQNGEVDPLGEVVWSMSKQATQGGREVVILALKDRRPDTLEPLLATLAIEKTGSNVFSEVKITMASSDAEPDDDGDGRVNSTDGCIGRANPLPSVDLAGPEGPDTPDDQEDECQTKCASGWPMVSPPEGTTAEDFWDCESELGSPHVKTRGDGSSLHYTGELVRDTDGAFLIQPGQRIRWMHTPAAQYTGPELPNPIFRIQPGNSARYRIMRVKHPDGRDNTLTFTHRPFGASQPIATPFSASTDWQESGGVGNGDTLESITGSFEIEARSENFVPGPDGVAVDGGENAADGGENADDGGGAIADAGESAVDAGEVASDGGDGPADSGAPAGDGGPATAPDSGSADPEDGGGTTAPADAGTDAGRIADSDAGQNGPDSGVADSGNAIGADASTPQDAGDTKQGNKSGGCGCDINGTQEKGAAANLLPLGLAIALGARIRRRIFYSNLRD